MAKKNAPPPQGPQMNEVMVLFMALALIFLGWFLFKHKISAFVLAVRAMEIKVISLFTPELNPVAEWIRVIDRRVVTATDLLQVSTMTGMYVRWVAAPLLLAMGAWLFLRSPTERFKRRFTDRTLPIAEAGEYPWIQVSLKNDFASMDADSGNWAMAMTERQFARAHGLRAENGEIDTEKAETVLVRQLGPLWLGYRSLRPHARGLAAMLAARICREFAVSDKLLLQLAASGASGKIDVAGVDEIWERYAKDKRVTRMIVQHAYERTVLMSLLERARGGEHGKDYLPPNWFLWLKGIDRGLWYAMSDVGRRTPHVESAGVFAHWLAEKARRKRLEMPFVKTAVEGLVHELSKFTDNAEDEGLSIDDDLLDLVEQPPAPKIPTPAEADRQRLDRQRQADGDRT